VAKILIISLRKFFLYPATIVHINRACPMHKKNTKKWSFANSRQSKALEQLRNKPFWIWNIAEHKQEDIKTNA
jgi:hypothetical protein